MNKVLIACSFLFSCGLLTTLIALGMFGTQGDGLTIWLEMIFFALAGGSFLGLFWGIWVRSNLTGIHVVLFPGAIALGLSAIGLPIGLLGEFSQYGLEGINKYLSMDALIAWIGMFSLLTAITFFPLIGPLLAHAYLNENSWPDVKQDFRDVMKAFKKSLTPKPIMPWE